MLAFPQLLTAATAQYPFRSELRARRKDVRTAGGYRVEAAAARGWRRVWTLPLSGMTANELARLTALFEACEGPLGTFCFVDPAGNALRWSNQLDNAVWQAGAGVALAGGLNDPQGGKRAWSAVGGAQAEQQIAQSVTAPGWYTYALSVYARAAAASDMTLVVSSTGVERRGRARIGTAWRRVSLTAELAGAGETVTCGVALAAGQSVELYGFQLEAQLGPSDYKETTQRGGVYAEARFASGELETAVVAPGVYAAAVEITAPVEMG